MGRGHKNNRNKRTAGRVHRKTKNRSRYLRASPTVKELKDQWDPTKSVRENYKTLGLVLDANHPSGADPVPEVAELFDVATVLAQQASSRIEKLSSDEMLYLSALVAKHGSNYEKMFRDQKLNFNQLTANQLKKKIQLLPSPEVAQGLEEVSAE